MGAKVDAFIKALKEINKQMKADNAAGHQWRYYNGKRAERTFAKAREKGKYYTNCSTGVYWGLRQAGVATLDQCNWYGTKGGIQWTSSDGKKKAEQIFTIVNFNGKTIGNAISDGSLKPGDILTYKNISHTNVYIGNNKMFDSGHAYCKQKSGEGAPFIKWIGGPSKSSQIAYVLRLKDTDSNPTGGKTSPVGKRKFVGKIKHTEAVNVRTGPGTNYPLLAEYPKLNPGNLVDVYSEATSNKGNKWYQVGIAGKYYGWVFAKRIMKT